MADQNLPDEWHAAASLIAEEPGRVLVIGGTDTGKTSFCCFMANVGMASGFKTAVVDADVGQSSIGPPATIGLGFAERTLSSLADVVPSGMYFVGAVSPMGHLLPMVVGTSKMVARAASSGRELIIVDTTGLVRGQTARTLKRHKAELVNPRHIVLLRRGSELDPVVMTCAGRKDWRLHQLPATPSAVQRSIEDRRAAREKKWADYFAGAGTISVSFAEGQTGLANVLLFCGREVAPSDYKFLAKAIQAFVYYAEKVNDTLSLVTDGEPLGDEVYQAKRYFDVTRIVDTKMSHLTSAVVGIDDTSGETRALGIIQAIDFKKRAMSLLTTCPGPEDIGAITVGSVRLTPDGRELERPVQSHDYAAPAA